MAKIEIPIVIKLGKRSKKKLKQLEKGEGKLMDEVKEVINQASEKLGDQIEDKVLMPVVVLYKTKQKRRNRSSLFNLF
jgi:hypothetical protein